MRHVALTWAARLKRVFGIEVEVLRGLGVDYAQGYGISQPQRVQRAAIA